MQCNPVCSLCSQAQETALHLILQCPYAEVWARGSAWSNGLIQVPDQETGIEEWWNKFLNNLSKNERRLKAVVLMYVAWNLWKERNRRVFEGRSMEPMQVLQEIKAEMILRKLACGSPELF
ncbi:hypothetical protein BAE44_0002452 [Dichanthelium oligosanthes]|uniref:Reverse transcriptase zinc-binding domain-containing protein n=1 Tax=Dichanthelium oligosanthes TaxID=888268 RepID=A0A1E5WGJ8_9POAL|nr:hypothetical protein BAE44_0002452 [Dichanthelium oligosanthes]